MWRTDLLQGPRASAPRLVLCPRRVPPSSHQSWKSHTPPATCCNVQPSQGEIAQDGAGSCIMLPTADSGTPPLEVEIKEWQTILKLDKVPCLAGSRSNLPEGWFFPTRHHGFTFPLSIWQTPLREHVPRFPAGSPRDNYVGQ